MSNSSNKTEEEANFCVEELMDKEERHTPKVQWLKVIQVTITEGKGVLGDPVRHVDYFYDENTQALLFIRDEWLIGETEKRKCQKVEIPHE